MVFKSDGDKPTIIDEFASLIPPPFNMMLAGYLKRIPETQKIKIDTDIENLCTAIREKDYAAFESFMNEYDVAKKYPIIARFLIKLI